MRFCELSADPEDKHADWVAKVDLADKLASL
jgi:hypothetical protein